MKKTIHLLSVCFMAVTASAPAVVGASLLLPPANVFYTSYEGNSVPPYVTGRLDGQNGWSLKGSTQHAAAEVVTGGTGGHPFSPHGSQMLALRNAKNSQDAYAGSPKVALQFSPTPYTNALYFSGVTGFSGTLSESTGVISRFYLNDTNEFNGVIFGLHQDEGNVRFFYNNGNTAVSFGESAASADTFYRFEVDVDIASKKFDVRVYDYASNNLLGSSADAAFRGNTTTLSYLRLNNLSNFPTNGDDFVTYYDQIWINTTAIPEPSTAWLMLGGACLTMAIFRRARQSAVRD